MGGGFSALDPTSNNFLGGVLPAPITRAVGDVATGGLAEFGRPDSFGLPPSIATPLKIGAGTIGGGLLGGPGGAFLGGTLGGMLGGNTGGGALGGGIGALLQSLLGGGGAGGTGGASSLLGAGLLGSGLAMNPSVGNVGMPSNAADQAAIQQQQVAQSGIFGQGQLQQQNLLSQALQNQRGVNQDYLSQLQGNFGTQNDLLGQRMQSQRDQLLKQLTTGPEGEAFREKYNNLGLLDSGAFNTGLADQFGNLAAQQQQDILGQGINQQNMLAQAAGQGFGNLSSLGGQGYGAQSGLAAQGTGTQSGLGQAGLGRQFGLEDTQTQFNIAQAIANAQLKAQQQQALIGGGSYILGGGMGGGMGGGGGGGAAPSASGGAGNPQISNLVQSLMGGIGNVGSSLGSLFGNLFGQNKPINTGPLQPNPIDPTQMSIPEDPNFPGFTPLQPW